MKLRLRMAGALLAWLLLGAGCGPATDSSTLPDGDLAVLDGGSYAVRQTGSPRVLNLWATWCAPCRAELPVFDDVAAAVDGVEIVGINTGDSGESARELVDELGLRFLQVLDPKASIQTALRITGMPSTIFVDAEGTIVEVHQGELDRSELEAKLGEHFDVTIDAG